MNSNLVYFDKYYDEKRRDFSIVMYREIKDERTGRISCVQRSVPYSKRVWKGLIEDSRKIVAIDTKEDGKLLVTYSNSTRVTFSPIIPVLNNTNIPPVRLDTLSGLRNMQREKAAYEKRSNKLSDAAANAMLIFSGIALISTLAVYGLPIFKNASLKLIKAYNDFTSKQITVPVEPKEKEEEVKPEATKKPVVEETTIAFDINDKKQRDAKVNEIYNQAKTNYTIQADPMSPVNFDKITIEKALFLLNNPSVLKEDEKRSARNLLNVIDNNNSIAKNGMVYISDMIANSKDRTIVRTTEDLKRNMAIESAKQPGYDGKRINSPDEAKLTEAYKLRRDALLKYMSIITADPNYRASNGRYAVQLILANANANFMQDYNCVNRSDKNGQPSMYYNKYFVKETKAKDGSVKSVEYDPIYQFGTEKHLYVQQGVIDGKKYTEEQLLKMGAVQYGIQQDLNDEYTVEWNNILGCNQETKTPAPIVTPASTEQLRVGIMNGYTISNAPMSAAEIIANKEASKGSYKSYFKHM